MRVHKRIKNLTEPEREQFETYLEKKLDAIRPVIEANYPDSEAVHVFAGMQKHDKHTAFAFDIILEIPRKRLMAEETKHTITEALDFSMQKLEQRLNKHFDRMTHSSRRHRSIRNLKTMNVELGLNAEVVSELEEFAKQ